MAPSPGSDGSFRYEIDVGDDEVEVGDEVVVMGAQGTETVSADEWAGWMETINYEVVCNFGPRLPRHYRRVDGS